MGPAALAGEPAEPGGQCATGLAIPTIRAVAESPAFLDASQKPSNNRGYLDPALSAEVVDWPADPRFEQLLGGNLDRALKVGDLTLPQAIDQFQAQWKAEKESPLARPGFPAFPWRPVATALGVVAAVAAVALAWLALAPRGAQADTREARWGWLLASPWVLGFALFMAFPIVMSLLLSLSKWRGVSTLDTATWVAPTTRSCWRTTRASSPASRSRCTTRSSPCRADRRLPCWPRC